MHGSMVRSARRQQLSWRPHLAGPCCRSHPAPVAAVCCCRGPAAHWLSHLQARPAQHGCTGRWCEWKWGQFQDWVSGQVQIAAKWQRIGCTIGGCCMCAIGPTQANPTLLRQHTVQPLQSRMPRLCVLHATSRMQCLVRHSAHQVHTRCGPAAGRLPLCLAHAAL